MRDVIYEMSRKGLGMTSVVEKDGRLAGIITDGDLRRKMSAAANVLDLTAAGRHDAEPRGDCHDAPSPSKRWPCWNSARSPRLSSSTPTSASKAWCTCTTSGAPEWSSTS